MTAFNQRDCDAMLAGVAALHECADLQQFPRVALRVIHGLVSSESSLFNYVAPTIPRVVAVALEEIPGFNERTQRFEQHLPEHPILRHYLLTGDGSARKISDFQSVRDFHATPLYQNIYREFGCEDQMTITLFPPGSELIGISLHRNRRSFTERERQVLNLLHPHVARAYRSVERNALANRALLRQQSAMHAAKVTTILLDEQDRPIHFGPEAEHWIQRFFPERPRNAARLPDTVTGWLRQTRQTWCGGLVRERDGCRIRLSLYPGRSNDGRLLVLGLETLPEAARRLADDKLTAREIAVLLEVEKGKTNDEVAAALGISPYTVRHHLEHIFDKLAVPSRTAAVTRFRQLCTDHVPPT